MLSNHHTYCKYKYMYSLCYNIQCFWNKVLRNRLSPPTHPCARLPQNPSRQSNFCDNQVLGCLSKNQKALFMPSIKLIATFNQYHLPPREGAPGKVGGREGVSLAATIARRTKALRFRARGLERQLMSAQFWVRHARQTAIIFIFDSCKNGLMGVKCGLIIEKKLYIRHGRGATDYQIIMAGVNIF